ncbi:MAG: hypothetical protein FWD61_04175 [Phycisphaerales bacterium]|nr:hypothetical protein [Phycisphaerales bacterium]
MIVGLAVGTVVPGGGGGGGGVFGQAMGKAAIESAEVPGAAPATSSLVVVPMPPVAAPRSPAAAVPTVPPVPTAVAATTIPAPTRQPSTATAGGGAENADDTTVKTVVSETQTAATASHAVPEFVVSMPAETIKSTMLPLEKRPIGGNGSETSGDKAAVTGGGGSGVMPGLMEMVKVGGALCLILGLVFVGKALAKKFVPGAQASNGKGVIEILARHPLNKNQSLVLVRIGSQIVAINQGKDQSQSVLVINEPTEVAKIMGQIEGTSPKSIQAGFTKLLANARMDLEKSDDDDLGSRLIEQHSSKSRLSESRESRSMTSSMEPEDLDSQLDEMAAAKRQLMQLRKQVRSVRDSIPQ